jgi:hypothetical protein
MVAGIRLCKCCEKLQAGILGGQHLLRCGFGSERNDTHHSIGDTMFYRVMRPEAEYSAAESRVGSCPFERERQEAAG